ncbi:response regulator [Nocardioides nematodiphilus]|uniref:response regulator n=1 Tax=Nocardioides nematodiphilus TaxID=2849669 RepID=UPI001CDA153C|nr:response regulator transcription factor [Nocardioides nematodiphilus]MCA1983186.1 response regulator transcription factor [Nocardioides nematodiphilus]
MQDGQIRVFLVDDHEIVRRGVRSMLEAEGDIQVVGEAGTARDALPAILALAPDVCVLDAQLPDGSGIDICRQMREANPDIKGLILTSYDDEQAITSAILAGAAGYVLKQIEGNSLVSGIRLVASGHTLIDPVIASRVVQQVQFHRRAFDVLSELTPQQSKILFLIAEGLTNRQIAERLFLAEKTVKNHVTGLLARLGVQHRTQAAVLAHRLRDGSGSSLPAPRRAGDLDAPRSPVRG